MSVARSRRKRFEHADGSVRGWPKSLKRALGYAPVIIECDRCHRPVNSMSLVTDGMGEHVVLDSPPEQSLLVDTDLTAQQLRLRQGEPGSRTAWEAHRAWVDPTLVPELRVRLVCHGRKHTPYERVITEGPMTDAYYRARVEGRDRIGMWEIERRPGLSPRRPPA